MNIMNYYYLFLVCNSVMIH